MIRKARRVAIGIMDLQAQVEAASLRSRSNTVAALIGSGRDWYFPKTDTNKSLSRGSSPSEDSQMRTLDPLAVTKIPPAGLRSIKLAETKELSDSEPPKGWIELEQQTSNRTISQYQLDDSSPRIQESNLGVVRSAYDPLSVMRDGNRINNVLRQAIRSVPC